MKSIHLVSTILMLLLLIGCSPQKDAGGTASEGESFVYGNVFDSTSAPTSLAKGAVGLANLQSKVVLTRLSYTDTGLTSTWLDSVDVSENGDFEVPVSESGVYTLVAQNQNGVSTVYAEVDFTGNSVNLGKLGMYNPIQLHASIRNLPQCGQPVRISIPGVPSFATLDEASSFTLSGIHPGRSTILAQCGDTIQQWQIVLPGSCSVITLDSIPWSPGNVGGMAAGRGIGQNPTMGFNWSWRQGGQLNVGSDCALLKNEDAGHGPMSMQK